MRVVEPCGKTAPPGSPHLMNIVFKMSSSSKPRVGPRPVRMSSELIAKGFAKSISVEDQKAFLQLSSSSCSYSGSTVHQQFINDKNNKSNTDNIGVTASSSQSQRLNQLKSLMSANVKSSQKSDSNPANSIDNSTSGVLSSSTVLSSFKKPKPFSALNLTSHQSPKNKCPPLSLTKVDGRILNSVKKNESSPSQIGSPPSPPSPPITPPSKDAALLFSLGKIVSDKLTSLGHMMKHKISKNRKQNLDDLCDDSSSDLSDDDDDDYGDNANNSEETNKEYELKVMMSSVISPNCFFVHVINEHTAHTLDALEKELKDLFQSRSEQEETAETNNERRQSAVFSPKKYQFCCAEFSQTGGFYRALILDITTSDDKQKVFLF